MVTHTKLNQRLFFLIILFLLGCQTTHVEVAQEQSYSLIGIKKAITSVIPAGIRKEGDNGRLLVSGYYSRHNEDDFDFEKARQRAYVEILILGDRRPYKVLLDVIIEERVEGKYVVTGRDKRSARQFAEAISKKLTQSREDRNVIDDFRPF